MNGTGLIIFIVVIIPILIMAVFLLNGKGAFLIAGYNTMSKQEKSKYDEKALCRFVGQLLIVISFCMALFPVAIHLDITWLVFAAISLLFGSVIFATIYANTGNRFKVSVEPAVDAGDTPSKRSGTAVVLTIVFSIAVLLAIGILFYSGGKDPEIVVNDSYLQINGMYGLRANFSDLGSISLIEKSMTDIGPGRRTNGYGGVGEALKGYFNSTANGDILLFVQSKTAPTILITRNAERDIYISFRDSDKTRKLYDELTAKR